MDEIRAEFNTAEDLPYWSYHVLRASFFTVQAAAGVLGAKMLQNASMFQNAQGETDFGSAFAAVSIPYSMSFRTDDELPHKQEIASITLKCSHNY